MLRFTTDTSVWPTINLSERGVRPLKTQQTVWLTTKPQPGPRPRADGG